MISAQQVVECVEKAFPGFGRNKKQELARLIFEIAKIRQCAAGQVLQQLDLDPLDFQQIKDQLLALRFPSLNRAQRRDQSIFPALEVHPEWAVSGPLNSGIDIQNIFIESDVQDSPWVQSFVAKLPHAQVSVISGYPDYIAHRKFTPLDYNDRHQTVFLIKEKQGFLVDCPCSSGAVSCGYKILNLGQGCGFDCAYCFLQGYVNSPGLVFPANLDDFFLHYRSLGKDYRLGTGQFMDSLLYDHLTGHSQILINFFRNFPKTIFELKTKSVNVELLLKTESAPNIVIAWSLNPQRIIDESEWGTATLAERLIAAKQCQDAGYRVAFHFDPIIYEEGWEREYIDVVDQMLERIDSQKIAWVSLGTLRMPPKLKQVIESRFPENTILNGEQVLGFDQKLRYSRNLRQSIYQSMIKALTKGLPREKIYLCMEDKEMFASCELPLPDFCRSCC